MPKLLSGEWFIQAENNNKEMFTSSRSSKRLPISLWNYCYHRIPLQIFEKPSARSQILFLDLFKRSLGCLRVDPRGLIFEVRPFSTKQPKHKPTWLVGYNMATGFQPIKNQSFQVCVFFFNVYLPSQIFFCIEEVPFPL